MDIKFENVEQLYKRVLPALRTKKRILLKKEIKLSEKQIFEYLIRVRWSKGFDLTLSDIVNDIINVEFDNLDDEED